MLAFIWVRTRIGQAFEKATTSQASVGITPIFTLSTLIAISLAPVQAQTVVPDGSLPTVVNQDGALNQFVVTGGSAQGGNLFHSFETFSPGDRSVLFNLSGESFGGQIERIFSRVTGSNVSEINGSLSIFGGNSPDLFLLNPNGIILGPNAQLNLPGSFVGTTARSLNFADGVSFSAASPQANPLLSISVPIGLQFGRDPGAISVLGTGSNIQPRSIPVFTPALSDPAFPMKGLSVAPGNTLALIGGPIQFDGGEVQSLYISNPDESRVSLGGLQLELGSIGSGQVGLTANPLGWIADYSEVQSYQDISFSNQSWLNVGGLSPSSITITGRNIVGEGGSTISLLNFGAEKNGDITLRASEQFRFSGTGLRTSDIENITVSSGDGGNVNLSANGLALADGTRLLTSSYGDGNAGEMIVQVNGDIQLNGLTDISNPVPNLTGIATVTAAQGNSGKIWITAKNIALESGAFISAATLAAGKSNSVTLDVEDSILISGVNPFSLVNSLIVSDSITTGDASGTLEINTAKLEVLDGGIISTSAFGTGNAGEILINASDYIRVGGFSSTPREKTTSRISSSAIKGGLVLDSLIERLPLTGNSGSVNITTPRLEVFEQGEIRVNNEGSGGAGDLGILTDTLSLSGQAKILAETESGINGNISILASESILLAGQSNITASSNGEQRGGNITLTTQHLVAALNSDSNIRADAVNSLGGKIAIDATSILGFNLTGRASEQTKTNDITASSGLGAEFDGTIELIQPNTDPVSGLAVLNDTLASSDDTRVTHACSASSTSLVRRGRGGFPLGPSNLLYDTLRVDGDHDPINQAIALREQGFYPQALAILSEEVLGFNADSASKTIAKNTTQSAELERQTIALRQLGITHKLLEQQKEGEIALNQSLAIAQHLNNLEQISATLLSLGNFEQAEDKVQQARKHYQQALDENPSHILKHQILANQLALEATIGNPEVAKHIAKDLLNKSTGDLNDPLHLQPRLNVAATILRHQLLDVVPNFLTFLYQALEGARAENDSTAIAHALGHLGQAYEQLGQFNKAQKFSEAALNQAQIQQDKFQEYQWAWQLGRSYAKQWKQSRQRIHKRQAQSAYQIALAALGELRGDLATVSPALRFSFQSQVEPVYREFVSLLLSNPSNSDRKVSTANLQQALQTIESLRVAELDNFFQDACLKATPQSIEHLDTGAAVIYPIILNDRVEVIVSHQGQLQHHTVPVDTQQLKQTTRALEKTLTTRSRKNYRQPSQQLYDWLIRPIAHQLEAAEIETLIFVPDGPLRNIPIAALLDGEQYLIEQFKVAIAPGLHLLPSQTAQTPKTQALVAGISKANLGFGSLAYVDQEVSSVKSILPTQALINEAFTQEKLERSLLETQTPIVHIATHGQFGATADETFIAAWNERIGIEQLHQLLSSRDRNQLTPTELLILSACETALGDDNSAALGLAGVAVRAGARSTLASLWNINDQSTATLMESFYQELSQPDVTKSAALRQAQLAMLEHPTYRHPYYWSAFVLMGNWQ